MLVRSFSILLDTEPPLKSNISYVRFLSLSKDKSLEMRQVYRSAVHQMLLSEEPSFFFITSCHWTEEELKTFFGTHFSAKTVLPTPKFQFGGATGSTVTSIIFLRKNQISPNEIKHTC